MSPHLSPICGWTVPAHHLMGDGAGVRCQPKVVCHGLNSGGAALRFASAGPARPFTDEFWDSDDEAAPPSQNPSAGDIAPPAETPAAAAISAPPRFNLTDDNEVSSEYGGSDEDE